MSILSGKRSLPRRAAWLAVWAGTVVCGLSVNAVVTSTPALAGCGTLTRRDEGSAKTLALACKKAVTVEDDRSSTQTVTANPDGSFTSTEWAAPHYVLRANGTWDTVDLSLHANSDGSISPVASASAVVLSGGGAGFFAKQVSDGKELVWSSPVGTLPKPRLSGSTATYPEVLSGVDLVVNVNESGFSEVLVVKNAAAAANPVLAQIGFVLSGSGLTSLGPSLRAVQGVDRKRRSAF